MAGEEHAVDVEEQVNEKDEAEKLKEAIDVQTEDIGTLRKKLTVTIPRDFLDERRHDQFAEIKRESIVPGFRKGRAPLRLIEKRFGAEVGDQLVSKLVGGSFMAAVDKTGLKTLGDPLIWVDAPVDSGAGKKSQERTQKLLSVEQAIEFMELPADGEMTYCCEVEIRPEFELPKLEGITIQKPKVEFSDEDVQSEIDRLLSMRGRFVPVDDKIRADDMVVADVKLTIDGEVVKEERNVTLSARAQRVEGINLDDLGEQLIGRKSQDRVTAKAEVGDEHEEMRFRGKQATFEVLVQDVKRLELPSLDEEFLTSIGFDSEEDLRSSVLSSMQRRLKSIVQRGMRGQVGRYLLENTTLDVPAGLSQRQTDRLVARRMIEMYQQGQAEQTIEKQVDELRSTVSAEVANDLKLFFIMEKIAEEMEIDVQDDEMNGEIARIAQQSGKRFDRVRDELAKGDGLTALYLRLRDDKILDVLLGNAEVKEVEGPKKSSSKTAKAVHHATAVSKPKSSAKPKSTGGSAKVSSRERGGSKAPAAKKRTAAKNTSTKNVAKSEKSTKPRRRAKK